jgi:hypothetical protein
VTEAGDDGRGWKPLPLNGEAADKPRTAGKQGCLPHAATAEGDGERQTAGRQGCLPHAAVVVGVLLLALALRGWIAAMALRDPALPRSSDDYIRVAQEWARAGVYTRTVWPPGYPALCRVMEAALGEGRGAYGVVWLQVLAGAASVALLLLIARAAGARWREALVAGALLAADPLSVIYTGLALTETVYTTLLMAGVYAALLMAQRGSAGGEAAGGGLALAAASLTRSVGSLSAAPVALWAGLAGPARPRVVRLRQMAILAGLVLVANMGWATANWRAHGRFTVTTGAGMNVAALWVGPARVAAQRGSDGGSMAACLSCWYPDLGARSQYKDQTEIDRALGRVARRWALAHPGEMVAGLTVGAGRFLLGPASDPWEKITGRKPLPAGLGALLLLWRVLLLGLGTAGAVLWWDRGGWPRQVLVLAVGLMAVHQLAVGCGAYNRFAVPVEPLVCLLAAAGALQVGAWLQALGRLVSSYEPAED